MNIWMLGLTSLLDWPEEDDEEEPLLGLEIPRLWLVALGMMEPKHLCDVAKRLWQAREERSLTEEVSAEKQQFVTATAIWSLAHGLSSKFQCQFSILSSKHFSVSISVFPYPLRGCRSLIFWRLRSFGPIGFYILPRGRWTPSVNRVL